MNLIIGGDFYINELLTENHTISNKLIELFTESDFNILNLEAPITNLPKENKAYKTGPNTKMDSETVLSIFNKLKINTVSLANNHIMDYGSEGLTDTLKWCESNNIKYFGAGDNLDAANLPLVLDKNGTKVAILNFAENEWGIAGKNKPGFSPIDVISNVYQIKEAKKNSDFVIVIIHGGNEYYQLPSPEMVKRNRFYIENGASAIICHHTHCTSGYEIINNSPIFYGIGNFLFSLKSKNPTWYNGQLIKIKIEDSQQLSWEMIPVSQSMDNFSLDLLDGKAKDVYINEINNINLVISSDMKLEFEWNKFIEKRKKGYLDVFNPVSAVTAGFLKKGIYKLRLSSLFIRKKNYRKILNNIRCESHNEACKSIIEKFIQN